MRAGTVESRRRTGAEKIEAHGPETVRVDQDGRAFSYPTLTEEPVTAQQTGHPGAVGHRTSIRTVEAELERPRPAWQHHRARDRGGASGVRLDDLFGAVEEGAGRRVDPEHQNLAVSLRKPAPGRARAAGRLGQLVVAEQFDGLVADRCHRVGRMQAPDALGPSTDALGDDPHDRRCRARIEGRRRSPGAVPAECERRHDERAERPDACEQGVDHRVGAAFDQAETAQGAVDDDHIPGLDAEAPQIVIEPLSCDDGRRSPRLAPTHRYGLIERDSHGTGACMNVIAISVHPDDETLGCGGSLLAHRDAGDVLDWLILTRPGDDRHTPDVVERKRQQVEAVARAYAMRTTTQLDLPAGRLDTVAFADVLHAVEATIRDTAPDLVYVVSPGDVHTDHEIGFRATMSVLKPFRMRALGVRRVEAYETLSSTEAAASPSFAPNVYRDISATIDEKLRVMDLYVTEVQPEPLPRSPSAIRALARLRGATVGVAHAEAFALVREIA